MMRLWITRVGTEEMRELERDRFLDADALGGFEFEQQLLPFDGQELDGHVAVEGFAICPAMQTVLIGESFVH